MVISWPEKPVLWLPPGAAHIAAPGPLTWPPSVDRSPSPGPPARRRTCRKLLIFQGFFMIFFNIKNDWKIIGKCIENYDPEVGNTLDIGKRMFLSLHGRFNTFRRLAGARVGIPRGPVVEAWVVVGGKDALLRLTQHGDQMASWGKNCDIPKKDEK